MIELYLWFTGIAVALCVIGAIFGAAGAARAERRRKDAIRKWESEHGQAPQA